MTDQNKIELNEAIKSKLEEAVMLIETAWMDIQPIPVEVKARDIIKEVIAALPSDNGATDDESQGKAFEAWCEQEQVDYYSKDESGDYSLITVKCMWIAWKAAISIICNRPVKAGDDFAWVVEGAWSPTFKPEYWRGSQIFTTDNSEALRFARKQDAEQAANLMLDGFNVRICEHGWSKSLPGPAHSEGWRLISEAPKDGTKILAYAVDMYAKNKAEMHTTFWNNGRWAWFNSHYPPTHFMNLPNPPSEGE